MKIHFTEHFSPNANTHTDTFSISKLMSVFSLFAKYINYSMSCNGMPQLLF